MTHSTDLETTPGSLNETAGAHHRWTKYLGLISCKHCGIVKRADGLNKPCPGKIRVELRENRIRNAL